MHILGIDLTSTADYLKSNPLAVLIGGAAGGYALRSVGGVYARVRALVKRQFTSELEVHYTRGGALSVARLARMLDACRLGVFSRNFTLDSSGERVVTGYGPGVALWHGLLISYERSFENTGQTILESLVLRFWTRDARRVQKFVDEANHIDDAAETIDVHEFVGGEDWIAVAERQPRDINAVFLNRGTREAVRERIAWFRDNEAWYARRGLNYKLVIVLYGEPGCGKTSLIQAIATEMHRDVYTLGSLFTIEQAVGKMDRNAILAIEDIDVLARLRREHADKKSDKPIPEMEKNADNVLHALLNILDGMSTPHGLVAVVTTNEIEKLDPALLRPCRIDLLLEIDALRFPAACEMFAAFFGDDAPARIDHLRDAWQPRTGASLQHALMGCTNVDEAVRALAALQAVS